MVMLLRPKLGPFAKVGDMPTLMWTKSAPCSVIVNVTVDPR